MTPAIRLLLVDDHSLFRQGLLRVLGDYNALHVVGQAANGEEALPLIDALQPDVVLMDVNMPVLAGPDTVRALRRRHPSLPVLMLTVSERDEDLFDAIRAGADGYLLKNVGAAELVDAVQRVHAGEAMLAPPMAARLLAEFRTLSRETPAGAEPHSVEELTGRERDVLRQVAQGLSNREIAAALHLSENTVKTHLANVLGKLHLRSRAHAAAYAVQAGLLDDA